MGEQTVIIQGFGVVADAFLIVGVSILAMLGLIASRLRGK